MVNDPDLLHILPTISRPKPRFYLNVLNECEVWSLTLSKFSFWEQTIQNDLQGFTRRGEWGRKKELITNKMTYTADLT